MTRIDSTEKEPVESDDETEKGFGFTEVLSASLLDTKKLTINVNAPDRLEDSSPLLVEDDAYLEEKKLHQYPPELAGEPQYRPPITSWEWNEDSGNTILDLEQSNMPFTDVMSFVAQFCPKLQILRLHANVPVETTSNLESYTTMSTDKGEEDFPKIEIYLRCRQTVLPFRSVMGALSSIFPRISRVTLDGDDHTELDILGNMHSLSDPFLPTLRRLRLEQFMGSLCLLTFFKFVVAHLPHLRFLEISQCNVVSQTGSAMDFLESVLCYLEIIPVNEIPFARLNELVFMAFKNISQFVVENIAAEHQIFLRLNWTKTGQIPTEKLYLKQSSPLKSFKGLLAIVKEFPRISKLEADECGSLQRTEILEIVSTCTRLQYLSSFAYGKSLILAISDQFRRQPTSKSISKFFGKQGGELRLETHGITLCVPEGAIQESEQIHEIEIGLQALSNPPSTHFQEDDMVSSFGFQCTIPTSPGYRFAKPVRVTLPHSAILDDPSKVETRIYSGELWPDTGDSEISTICCIPPSEDKLPRCEVDKEKITVFIDHFSFAWPVFKIRNPFVRGKRLGCLSFAPRKMPPTEKPIIRVHLFDNVKGNPEEITKDETECDFCKIHPKKELKVKANVDVTLAMEGSDDNDMTKRTILYKDIRKLVQNTVDFTLDFSARAEHYALVNLMLSECVAKEKRIHDIHFNVNFSGDTARSSLDARVYEGLTSEVNNPFDQILLKVARKMCDDQDIENLAVELGFTVEDAKRFLKENHEHGFHWRGTLNMLREWRKGVDKPQERTKLREALLSAGQVNLTGTLLPGEGE